MWKFHLIRHLPIILFVATLAFSLIAKTGEGLPVGLYGHGAVHALLK